MYCISDKYNNSNNNNIIIIIIIIIMLTSKLSGLKGLNVLIIYRYCY
jgi:hypothetical protein